MSLGASQPLTLASNKQDDGTNRISFFQVRIRGTCDVAEAVAQCTGLIIIYETALSHLLVYM